MKFFFASVLGSAFGMVLAFLLFILIAVSVSVGVASKTKNKKVDVKPNTVMKISLNAPISERTSNNPFEEMDLFNFEPKRNLGLNDILANIKAAKDDDNIKGIYLDLSIMPSGLATIDAVRNELLDFKMSGKFILAYGEMISQKAYYLGSVADKIYANPVGYLEFRGFAVELTFLKGMLDKLGIAPQVLYAGKYKSATEPLRLEKMSDANKEQVSALIGGTYNFVLKNIASARKLPVDVLDSIASNLVITDVDKAVQSGMIDGKYFLDEVIAELKSNVGIEDDEDLNWININNYTPDNKESESKDKIAVLYAEGGIVDGAGEQNNIGSKRFAKTIRSIRQDEDVKALVFRINSGGGSALASDVILREIKLAQKKMPVIVSMGNVAASGGYYIACSADTILAEPTTITGSIGVFGVLPNMQKFFNEKLGVTFDGVKTGRFSDMGMPTRPLRPEERMIIQAGIDTIYLKFKKHVAEGREMTVEDVDLIAQGRVWTGIQALEIGLVDLLGGLDEAIDIAAMKAGLEEYKIESYPEQKDPLEKFLEEFGLNAQAYYLKQTLGEHYHIWREIEEIKNMRGVQARIPYDLHIY